MADPAANLSYDDAVRLLNGARDRLRDLENAASAAGSNTGIREEIRLARAEVLRLKDVVTQWDQPARAAAPEPHPIIEALPPPPPAPRPAIRLAKIGPLPRLSDNHTAIVGQYGAPRARPAAAPLPMPQPAAPSPPATPAVEPGTPLAGVKLPNGPRITITAAPDGSVRTEIEGITA
jgi:hypothetical protein